MKRKARATATYQPISDFTQSPGASKFRRRPRFPLRAPLQSAAQPQNSRFRLPRTRRIPCPMNLSQFYRLLNPEGTTALAAATLLAPTESTLLACHQRLRKQFPGELALAAIETVMLRRKAADKFSRADAMFFTREGLEQSSGETISTYRSRRFASFGRVGDFCCGIGGDTIGLTGVTSVFAVDADPLRLAMAAHNVSVYARSERAEFRAGDLLAMPLPKLAAAFFDPDRRADGRRHLRIREYAPALDAVRARLPAGYPLVHKIAPGVPWSDLHAYDAETEFISVAGELKECVLWFGAKER